LHPLPTHDFGEAVHQCTANTAVLVASLDTERVERGYGLLTAKFPTQNTGEGKTHQHAITGDANMDEIFPVLLGMVQPFLEKSSAWLTHVPRVDGDNPVKIRRA
jgi:hypothetical protein